MTVYATGMRMHPGNSHQSLYSNIKFSLVRLSLFRLDYSSIRLVFSNTRPVIQKIKNFKKDFLKKRVYLTNYYYFTNNRQAKYFNYLSNYFMSIFLKV